MPGLSVDVGTGTTMVFGTSGFTLQLTGVDWSGITRRAHETTHMGTAAPGAGKFGNRTFIPGRLSDPGEIRISGFFNAQTNPPIDAVPETITVTWPKAPADATAANWAASGFMTDVQLTDPVDDIMTLSGTVKLSGNVTMTDAT